jgi:UDP-N-acetylglucosamine 2-epimerase (non-hydrolysing)
MKIIHAVGARPNFMKAAPVIEAFERHNRTVRRGASVQQILVHTGQHYDENMSALFFTQLGLPRPDVNLGVGSGPHGQQTGRIMELFERVLEEHRPDLVIVVGDVNSTVACTLDAKKANIAVAHVEAGLRSGDRTMPEEINRIMTDSVADLLFTTDRGACHNLRREGVAEDRIHFVGNVMIDTLLKHKASALALPSLRERGLENAGGAVPYALVTLHRPSNVDAPGALVEIGEALADLARTMPVIFPAHPRTRTAIVRFGLTSLFSASGLRLVDPVGYLEFLSLQAQARLVLTDSGGVQEETTILGVPCLTLRPNTERPITVSEGTNMLVESRKEAILEACRSILTRSPVFRSAPEFWDGRAAERIVDVIVR